jgi:predicted GH43/DUF377 family glycosyl hydrolase
VLKPRWDHPQAFDSEKVECPMVIRHQGRWLMFYSGLRKTGQGLESTIGRAVSDDLIHWRDRRQVLKRGPEGRFDHGGLSGPFVWAEGDQLFMIYIGFPRLGYEARPGRHGLATSTDGLHWKKAPFNPIHGPGPKGSWNDEIVYKVFVMRHEGRYWMFYNAYGTQDHCEQIGLATSTDLRQWKEHPDNPLLRKGDDPRRDRDNVIIGDPWILRRDGRWEMYYFAYDGRHARECLATSNDLIHWKKSPYNPIMDAGPPDSYDAIHCHKPCIIEHKGVYYHFYTAVGPGRDGNEARTIGLATSKKLPDVE